MSNKNNSNTATAKKENGKGKATDAKPKADMKPVKGPSIEEIQKVLDEQISKFQRKSELIANRERFNLTKKELTDYLAEQGPDFDDTLDSEHLRIHLYDNR